MDLDAVLRELSARRPMFHPERDFQHELTWQIRLMDPALAVRLETRPARDVHLDILVRAGQHRTAIEVKYLLAGHHGTVGSEQFDLPNRSAREGTLAWAACAGAGTTRNREQDLALVGTYTCHWSRYATVSDVHGHPVEFRY